MLIPLTKSHSPNLRTNVDINTLSQQQLRELVYEHENSLKIQQLLYQIASTPVHAGELHKFYESIHQALAMIIYAENIIIATLDDEEKKLTFDYFRDSLDSITEQDLNCLSAERVKYTLTGYVLRTGQALLADEEKMEQLMQQGEVCQMGKSCVSWLGVPLVFENNVCGVLAVQSYTTSLCYTDAELELLHFVASHISSAIYQKKTSDKMHDLNLALTQAKSQLEEKVQKRTNELVKANYELHKLLRQQEQTQAKLSHDALHDSLTGLPNRNLFIDRLLQAMHRHNGREQLTYAVLFIDLDRFKVVNDSLGHLTGDLLLKEVAVRLEKTMRICDSIARFGGDEFCILLEGNVDQFQAVAITERIIEEISKPFTLQGYEIFTSPSVGITLSQSYYKDPEEILRDADAAMYQAKFLGKARYALFDVSMHKSALNRLQLEADLRLAVKNDELSAYFQPIVNLTDRKIIGFEALSRWQHPSKGFINPEEFIGIAEETGLITELGHQILSKALSELSHWHHTDSKYQHLTMSVNLSPRQLENENLVAEILALLRSLKLPPKSLKLEVTEGVLIDSFSVAKNILNQFDQAGIKVMLDDFGTGFSSLSYLHHFPIKIVKIDRSFIHNMFHEATDMAIIKSVENMASGLNMQVVAEGIENEEQFTALEQLGIDFGQGYLVSKPLPANQVLPFMAGVI